MRWKKKSIDHFLDESEVMLNQPYEIRIAGPSDAAGVIACMQSVMSEKIYLVSEIYLFTERGQRDIIKNPDDLTLVSIVDNEVVGTLNIQRGIYKKNRHTANLGIAIKKGHRGKRLGSQMIKYSIDWCATQGIAKLNLEVFSTNESAIKLYKRLGFKEEGVRKGQFKIDDQYVDDIFMTIFPLEKAGNFND